MRNEVEQLDWGKSYFVDAYPFTLIQIINDCYFLEPNGYLVIRDSNSNPMSESIEQILKKVAIKNTKFDISSGVSEPEYEVQGSFKALVGNWEPKELKKLLYFIQLTKENVEILTEKLNLEKSNYHNLAFHANWISYFRDTCTLIDVIHANDGLTEQLHISKAIPDSRVQQFLKNRDLKIKNT